MDKYRYWSLLRRAYQDYYLGQERIRIPAQPEFVQYMREQWGIKVGLDIDGHTEHFDITDEHKYLLFELTYAGNKDTR